MGDPERLLGDARPDAGRPTGSGMADTEPCPLVRINRRRRASSSARCLDMGELSSAEVAGSKTSHLLCSLNGAIIFSDGTVDVLSKVRY